DLYLRLRRMNPGPYMGFLRWEGPAAPGESPAVPGGGGALLSTSPELLLELDGNMARTRPIKGTAPRGATPEEDESNARALLASEKDRAELAMIVDLERNDLGRVAETGTVRVENLPRIESYATVHHLMADVIARPRADVDAVDALAALFPGGSVTGAPKLRAMERIAELEGEGRGFFTGSLGMLDTRGRAVFNILIRTMLWRPGEVSFRVGGGITWSSDPAAEDRETLAKGAALARALETEAAACP
ncbi:MAG: anthranilate synthase component I family protein, partial [Planctomycetota bacterium]|nr:anthranilate synthase component I family protein [Planctomycetota bacterium]